MAIPGKQQAKIPRSILPQDWLAVQKLAGCIFDGYLADNLGLGGKDGRYHARVQAPVFVDKNGIGCNLNDPRFQQALRHHGLRWGEVAVGVTTGNAVTLYPCDRDGTNTDTGGTANVTAYVVTPTGQSVSGIVGLSAGQVVAYIPAADDPSVGVLVATYWEGEAGTSCTNYWAKTGATWNNVANDESWVLSDVYPARACAGSTYEAGVSVRLPRYTPSADPNVLPNRVLPVVQDTSGTWVTTANTCDGTIDKSVEAWEGDPDDLATDRPGWGIFARLAGKFPVVYDAGDSTYDTGNTGGFLWHGLTENNHNDHDLEHTHCVLTGVNCVDTNLDGQYVARFDSTDSGEADWDDATADHDGPYNTNQDTDNRPPWGVLFLIIREDNARA